MAVFKNPARSAKYALKKANMQLKLSEVLASPLDLQNRLERILDLAVEILDAERGSIMLLDESKGRLKMLISKGIANPKYRNVEVFSGEGISGWVLENRKSLILHDSINTKDFTGIDSAIRSSIAVPLESEDSIIGVLNVSTKKRHRFNDSDLELMEAFSRYAASALENAVLYARIEEEQNRFRKELELGSQIQRSIVKTTTPLKNVNVIARLIPASAVGGDFYNVIPFEKGDEVCFHCARETQDMCDEVEISSCPFKFSVLIGDVANKGLPASLVMAVLMTALNLTGARKDSPAEILQATNLSFRKMVRHSHFGFATLFYAFIDIIDNKMVFSRAGHEPPLLIRTSGTIESLDSEGYPVGFMQDGDYEEIEIDFNAGDRLVLYTDGVTGAVNREGKIWGRRSLIDFTKSNLHVSAEEYMDGLLDEAMVFGGDSPPSDDIAILILDNEPRYDMRKVIDSRMQDIRTTIDGILELCTVCGADREAVRLCCEEIIHNAMEHANKWNASKQVVVLARTEKRGLRVFVRDSGEGFDLDATLEKMKKRLDKMDTRGRGLIIVEHYTKMFSYNNTRKEAEMFFETEPV